MKAGMWAAAVVFGLAGSALGQYALDHSLQVGSSGQNGPGRDFKKELEFRNAIVTGNAPGGISFRGDVGYKAPGEFFGHLGTNDTFSFRRDSAYSGLAGYGLRGTDALQYQFAVTTGNAPPRGLTGIPVFSRTGAGGTANDHPGLTERAEGLTDLARPKPGQYGYDTRGLSLMSVRSPSAYVANRGLQPTLLGRDESTAQSKAITASMLRGVAYDDIGVLVQPKPKEEKKPATGLPSTALPTAMPSTEATTSQTPETVRTAYDDLVDRMGKDSPADGADKPGKTKPNADKPGSDKDGDKKADDVPDWKRRIEELRGLLSDKARGPNRSGKAETKPAPKPGENPAKPADKGGDQEDETNNKKPSAADQDTLGIIKRAGEQISALAPPSYDQYGSQMQAGQDHLAAGRYFDAEERFTTALAAKAGDPMAMVGRIHAQLGAGMFLSAAINLRGLLTEHPELAGMRYTDRLLPKGEREGKIMERLSELVGEPDGKGRDPGLLMAYMGYQTGDRTAMKRGLEAMSAGGPAEPDQLARLAAVLSKVWADADAKPPPDAKPPAPVPAPAKPPEPKK